MNYALNNTCMKIALALKLKASTSALLSDLQKYYRITLEMKCNQHCQCNICADMVLYAYV